MGAKAKSSLRIFLTGFSMGIVDLIPGVSGGTVAFLSGIYEELLYGLKILTSDVPRLVFSGRFFAAFSAVPFSFFIPLALGMLSAIFGLSGVILHLIDFYPIFLWSFFFGLIGASVFVLLKRIVRWDWRDVCVFLGASAAAYLIVGMREIAVPDTNFFLFLSGIIAITAMIMPGISGSFMLVILGKYDQMLAAVSGREILTLAIFAFGCLIGIAVFARALSALFMKHHDISIAALSGFVLGSMPKIWPWKDAAEANILPSQIDAAAMSAIAFALFGAFFVIYLDRKKIIKEETLDIPAESFKVKHESSLRPEKN